MNRGDERKNPYRDTSNSRRKWREPLGRDRFLRVTGITEHELGRQWARYGDAVRESGFEPDKLNVAHDDGFLMEKHIGLARRLGHAGELDLGLRSDPDLTPGSN